MNTVTMTSDNSPDSHDLKGGRLARQAAMLCQSEEFRLWLDRRRRVKFNMDIPDGTHTEQDARDFICDVCAIESRAQLDHNPAAAKRFSDIIRYYNRYLRRYHAQ